MRIKGCRNEHTFSGALHIVDPELMFFFLNYFEMIWIYRRVAREVHRISPYLSTRFPPNVNILNTYDISITTKKLTCVANVSAIN